MYEKDASCPNNRLVDFLRKEKRKCYWMVLFSCGETSLTLIFMVDVGGKTISSVELLYIAISVKFVVPFPIISPLYIHSPPACESKGDNANPSRGT